MIARGSEQAIKEPELEPRAYKDCLHGSKQNLGLNFKRPSCLAQLIKGLSLSLTSKSCVDCQTVIKRHCVNTEKSLCIQGNSVSTQEVLTLCQPFQSNNETLCRHRKIAVYSRNNTKNKGAFAQINLVSTIK